MSESKDCAAATATATAGSTHRRTFPRSISWTDRSSSNRKPPQPTAANNKKSRSLLPPLRPLSINKRSIEEWPSAGSDDLGVWPQSETPKGRVSITGSEFQFKRDKLAFYDKECSRIAEHVYLGSDTVAKNHELLRQKGITHVLNCVGFVCPEYFKRDFVYKTLWLQDSPTEDITSILYDVFDYFEDVRLQGGRVLVHCCQGVSRSTSLVIAYLMWREGQSFEDAFHYVKNARGVTNPNMGFASQLLQCQKRVVNLNSNSNSNAASPLSPNSVLRMFRMAPHSPYDPLHLVPKMVNKPSAKALDSRGAFIVHVPSAIYVWIGKFCSSVMSCNAKSAAIQVVRYEKANAPILTISEDDEPMEFWAALSNHQLLLGNFYKGELEKNVSHERMEIDDGGVVDKGAHPRKVDEYDLDFGIFNKALAGGVVPPFSVTNTGSETLLPARENSWGRLRRKLANRIMKGLFTSSKCCDITSPRDELKVKMEEEEEKQRCVSSGYLDYFIDNSSDNAKDCLVLMDHCFGSSLPPTPRRKSVSFPCSLSNSPKFGSKSPTLSPSNSDYTSSFSFSPVSMNWSDLSFISSRLPSPSGHGSAEQPFYVNKDGSLIERSTSLHNDAAVSSSSEALLINHIVRKNSYKGSKSKSNPSIAERRGSKLLPQMLVPSHSPRAHKILVRSPTFTLLDRNDNLMK
ncbi:protein-tyrosine-phosphatase MKP1-like [Cicer arietinum]|uniref:Protein-tyrosine-phosphatase MKP1-like n=1 Tax=Cicer arietinum TaxID=3827 RepID=A0A1S2YFQ4_CICAR|nr:protein-tyrosine-phosphatase MKP1-like [Cicer arietinum]